LRRARIDPVIIEVDSFRAMTDIVQSGQAFTISPSCGLPPGDSSLWWSPIARLSITWTFAVQETRKQSIVVRAVGDLLKLHVAEWANSCAWAHSLK
jgi:hypothetical protein